jgi:CheY-like chemotaxis protein
MDDEPAIRDILTRMLEKLGCDVTATADGEGLIAAYQTACDAQRPYDLVISDLTVPGGMGGREALEILRRFDPGIKTIVSSGYAADSVPDDFHKDGCCGVLLKPYTFSSLKTLIRELFPNG